MLNKLLPGDGFGGVEVTAVLQEPANFLVRRQIFEVFFWQAAVVRKIAADGPDEEVQVEIENVVHKR